MFYVVAVLLAFSRLQASDAGTGSLTVVQICDPQLGMTDYRENVCALEQLVEQVNLISPDYAVICGDMVNTANEASLSDFIRIREAFAVPVLCAPGYHDVCGPVTNNLLETYRSRIGADYFSVRRSGLRLIILNTPLLKWPVAGETERQMVWLRSELKAAQSAKEAVYACVHVPPFVRTPDEPENWQNLPEPVRTELLDLFRSHGVRAVLAGHLHNVMDCQDSGIRFVAGETPSLNFDKRPQGFRLWKIAGDSFTNTFVPLYRKKDTGRGTTVATGPVSGPASECVGNLRFLDAAKEALGMSCGLTNGSAVAGDELSRWIRGGLDSVRCPAGGTYSLKTLAEDPVCSAGGHVLPSPYRFDEFRARAAVRNTFRDRLLRPDGVLRN